MANEQNLIPFKKGTISKEEAQKNGRKGGIKSAESRRRKSDLRKLAQQVLLDKHIDKNGKEFTGEEAFVRGLIANLANPNSKNWGKTMDLLIQLTGAGKTKEERKRIKAETKMMQAKIDLLTGADTTTLDKLDELLKEQKDNANTE